MRRLHFGYNTNGFAHHGLEDALTILARLGYDSAAITVDHAALNPFDPIASRRLPAIRKLLQQFRHPPVIETGARFLLDPWRKHRPTLISQSKRERDCRLGFLKQCINLATSLHAEIVSFWSGASDDDARSFVKFAGKKRRSSSVRHVEQGKLWTRLRDGCLALADYAARRSIRLAFEPEPGMFIDTMDQFAALRDLVQHPHFGLTIDIGHLHCQGEPIENTLREWRHLLWNIHIDDMRRGVHEHLMFGEGEIDFGPVVRTLCEVQYGGGIFVELSRHSHDAVAAARKSLSFLKKTLAAVCA